MLHLISKLFTPPNDYSMKYLYLLNHFSLTSVKSPLRLAPWLLQKSGWRQKQRKSEQESCSLVALSCGCRRRLRPTAKDVCKSVWGFNSFFFFYFSAWTACWPWCGTSANMDHIPPFTAWRLLFRLWFVWLFFFILFLFFLIFFKPFLWCCFPTSLQKTLPRATTNQIVGSGAATGQPQRSIYTRAGEKHPMAKQKTFQVQNIGVYHCITK